MPTQKLFLDNTGLTLLLNELGQYLKGKEEKRLVVTIDTSLQSITADKTYNEIAAAYNNGSDIILDALGYFYKLITVDGNYFCFELRPYDEPGVSYYLTLNPNNVWTLNSWSGQLNLISGTNVKTINNTSILGSGNFNLTPRIEYASKTAMDADGTLLNGTLGYDRDGEIWYIYDQANGEWRLIDASGGGGNITLKTINNTSLIGSGNIEVLPVKFTVTMTQRGARYTFNKTYAEILAAYNAGADVELLEVSSNEIYKLSFYNEDDEIITFERFSGMSTLCQWYVDSSDSWDYDDFTFQRVLVNQSTIKSINYTSLMGSGNISLQEPLVSGTNIKTINNQSILGSGNISISGGSADLTNYYTKSEIDTMIGDVETILASI